MNFHYVEMILAVKILKKLSKTKFQMSWVFLLPLCKVSGFLFICTLHFTTFAFEKCKERPLREK